MAEPEQVTFYEAAGGEETFRVLVHHFYQGVAADPALRAMYPEEDLGPAEERLRLFLIQYWGGPNTYSQQRGHPRLRMRHVPFVVDEAAKEAWLRHMRKALDETVAERGLPPQAEQMLWNYFTMAAQAMINSPS
ncbi:globin [Actinomadura logoneensis]|uniref:Globin n=1 Tax=Actinomadura logoneensis TaxID=2293572 RepID=A0A372JC99_9ACTN|nr:globin [Actinomadura logoneensis]RFU37637.1 globin [Actinomadura logoneensis]